VTPPEVGVLVLDTERGRLGEVMGHEGPYIQLRPVAGGREWDADPAGVRRVTDEERIGSGRERTRASLRGPETGGPGAPPIRDRPVEGHSGQAAG
jgi:hypothetical protein